MVPKSRLDALSDGIFAFAMTLLVLDVRLPPDLQVTSREDLAAAIAGMWPGYLTYLISFAVLAAQWRSNVALRDARETLSGSAARVWLLYLFFITSVPLSSGIVSRYGEFAPAIWLYSANMLVLGALMIPLHFLAVPPEARPRNRRGLEGMALFTASALLAVVISLFEPRHAMYAYILNMAGRFPLPGLRARRAEEGPPTPL